MEILQRQTELAKSRIKLDYLSLKRVLDCLIALALIILSSPFMLVIALAIKLFSPGPALFRQTRIGKDGQPFVMWKFRTMRYEAAQDLHRDYVRDLILNNHSPQSLGVKTLKLDSDPRITGLGKILRRFSLDELPQLFNVLRGEMSIVGPRPSLPYELELYQDWHKERLYVLPGITGLWQVTARNQVCFDDQVRIDLDYIQQMCLWLDLKIMLHTPFEMIKGKGGG